MCILQIGWVMICNDVPSSTHSFTKVSGENMIDDVPPACIGLFPKNLYGILEVSVLVSSHLVFTVPRPSGDPFRHGELFRAGTMTSFSEIISQLMTPR